MKTLAQLWSESEDKPFMAENINGIVFLCREPIKDNFFSGLRTEWLDSFYVSNGTCIFSATEEVWIKLCG